MVENPQKSKEDNFQRFKDFLTLTSDGFYYLNCRQPIDIQLPIQEQVDQFYAHTYVEECNPAMAAIFGFASPEEVVGKPFKMINQGPLLDSSRAILKQFFNNNYRLKSEEYFHESGKGKGTYFLVHAQGIIKDGYLKGLWGSRRDITEKKLSELRIKNREFFIP